MQLWQMRSLIDHLILLLCLRDVRFCANERNIGKWETFSDSLYIQDYWKEYFAIAFKKWSRRF